MWRCRARVIALSNTVTITTIFAVASDGSPGYLAWAVFCFSGGRRNSYGAHGFELRSRWTWLHAIDGARFPVHSHLRIGGGRRRPTPRCLA